MKIISIEGIDGSGKSYLIDRLKRDIKSYKNISYIRFPSSNSKAGKFILENLNNLNKLDKDIVIKALLEDMKINILNELESETDILITDRSFISTSVYQNHEFSNGYFPYDIDLLIYLDTDKDLIRERNLKRLNSGSKDKFDEKFTKNNNIIEFYSDRYNYYMNKFYNQGIISKIYILSYESQLDELIKLIVQ